MLEYRSALVAHFRTYCCCECAAGLFLDSSMQSGGQPGDERGRIISLQDGRFAKQDA